MIKRNKISRSKITEEVPESYVSPLAASENPIPESSESVRNHAIAAARGVGGLAKILVTFTLIIIAVVLAVYTSLAATLMVLAPSIDDDVTERSWVARGTFVGGMIDPGTFVYGSATSAAPEDFMGKIMEGYFGASDPFVAEVIAGPVAKVSTDKADNVLVNGEKTGYTGTVENTELRSQFLAVCVTGACEPGEIVVIESGAISGEYKGAVSITGVEKPESLKDVVSDDTN